MGYYQRGLSGSGTEVDPFIISSYSEWLSINPMRSADMNPPYYKLITDINMDSHGEWWKPTDFADAHLNMNGHSILSPRIPTGHYFIKNADIYSNELAYVEDDGTISNKTDYGQILNIYGAAVEYVFANCSFSRILCDLNAKGMWLTGAKSNRMGLFTRITSNQSHFKVTNEGYDGVIFTSAATEDNSHPIIDSLFEFFGEAYDTPLFSHGSKDATASDKLLSHCMISGELDCGFMTKNYRSSDCVIVDGRMQSCIVYLRGNYDPDFKGYRGFCNYSDPTKMSIALTEDDSGLYVVNQDSVARVSDNNMRNPNYLQELGLDLIKTK